MQPCGSRRSPPSPDRGRDRIQRGCAVDTRTQMVFISSVTGRSSPVGSTGTEEGGFEFVPDPGGSTQIERSREGKAVGPARRSRYRRAGMAAISKWLAGGTTGNYRIAALESSICELAGAPGLEPGTLCLEGRCSIQLSYAPATLLS